MTCELYEKGGVWHHGNHFYKFDCSDYYLAVRSPDRVNDRTAPESCFIVHDVKYVSMTADSTLAGFRLIDAGMLVDYSNRPNGDLRNIYSELYPAEEVMCVCGDHFETTEDAEAHKLRCLAYAPVPRNCGTCSGNIWDYGPHSWKEHQQTCIKCTHLPRPNECKTCTMLYPDAEALQAHKCRGSPVEIIWGVQPRWSYIYGFTEEQMWAMLGGLKRDENAPPPTPTTPSVDPAVVEANKEKLESTCFGCKVANSDILVCNACKKARKVAFCLWCGSGKENERVKACGNCRENRGGGWGRHTGKHKDISACCIHCGGQSGLVYYNVCVHCRKQYGAKCYYKYCSGL